MNDVIFASMRQFFVFSFQMSHGVLILRSAKSDSDHTRVEVIIFGVRAWHIPTCVDGLVIRRVAPEFLDGYASKPSETIGPRESTYALSGADWKGFVVGGRIVSKEDDRDLWAPSQIQPPDFRTKWWGSVPIVRTPINGRFESTRRLFSVYCYQLTENALVLRASRTNTDRTRVDVLFTGVRHMEMRSWFKEGVTIVEAVGSSEKAFLLDGRGWSGVVAAEGAFWAEDDGDLFDPSPLFTLDRRYPAGHISGAVIK